MLINFFDKLEDKVRHTLSHFPIFYAIIGVIGVVLVWRGVWHTIDYLMLYQFHMEFVASSPDLTNAIWWDGPLSFLIGTFLLLMTGLFVSSIIGNEIIISGLRGEKKLSEKSEKEIKTESQAIKEIRNELRKISDKLDKSRKN